MDDRAIVVRQLGREPRAFRGVAARCPWGLPAVTEQEPVDVDGRPFPTTYYLTCPHLVVEVSRLEAAAGVERWTAAAASDPALHDSLERANEEQRRIRRRLAGDAAVPVDVLDLGIAGSRGPGSLKCLHAHVAFALARPGYELGERILREIDPRWPEACCST
jgi:uncharacterized protein